MLLCPSDCVIPRELQDRYRGSRILITEHTLSSSLKSLSVGFQLAIMKVILGIIALEMKFNQTGELTPVVWVTEPLL